MNDKTIKGLMVCTHCDNAEMMEREVRCWSCGEGEMVWLGRDKLNKALKIAWGQIFPHREEHKGHASELERADESSGRDLGDAKLRRHEFKPRTDPTYCSVCGDHRNAWMHGGEPATPVTQAEGVKCPKCGEPATYQTPDGTFWDSNAHFWREQNGGAQASSLKCPKCGSFNIRGEGPTRASCVSCDHRAHITRFKSAAVLRSAPAAEGGDGQPDLAQGASHKGATPGPSPSTRRVRAWDDDKGAFVYRDEPAPQEPTPQPSARADELLPCPFCGETLVLDKDQDGEFWWHSHRASQCWLVDACVANKPDGEGGIDDWNRRAPLAPPPVEGGEHPVCKDTLHTDRLTRPGVVMVETKWLHDWAGEFEVFAQDAEPKWKERLLENVSNIRAIISQSNPSKASLG